ncbi:MAG: proline--tRNA ligase, partial [Candidatus Micrarchaeota archaeon]|nr:proline--tRNA ligase [Candidatus Micrarchaeota archaeon]
DGKTAYAYQNTFAITTRELGVMVATHGDDKGLVIPPRLACIQVVIVPIYKKGNQADVKAFAEHMHAELRGNFRVRLDDREGYSPGFKFNEWELKGVPLRIEIGEKEMSSNNVMVVRRDTGEKQLISNKDLSKSISALLGKIHENLYDKAVKFLESHVTKVNSYDDFKKVLKEKGGIITAPWCGDKECELKIKEEMGTKITNIPLDQGKFGTKCIICAKKSKYAANFARSY